MRNILIASSLALTLVSCGGGSGSSTPPQAVAPAPAPNQTLTTLLGPTSDNPLLHAGGIARDSSGNMYVSDLGRGTIIKLTASGVVSQFAKFTADIGPLTFDGAGNLYGASGTTIHKFATDGSSTLLVGSAGFGNVDGTAAVARFRAIRDIFATSDGTLYVTDNRTVRKVDPTGKVTTIAGHCDPIGEHDGDTICAVGPSVDGDAATARFTAPGGIALDAQGTLYIHDGAIRTVGLDGGVRTLQAGDAVSKSGRGGIARDPAGNIYLGSIADNAVLKVTPGGSVTTLASAVGQTTSYDIFDVKYIDAHTLLVLTSNTVQLLTLP
ncbi:hypothetical protein [Duganella sp. S19_KUP01_CR8]|uniref:hypothetical protein n=1 Tax=Duganella sp. S19_KUP01_CR8 TaxID=3025502 RepID=UPI002FCDDA1A